MARLMYDVEAVLNEKPLPFDKVPHDTMFYVHDLLFDMSCHYALQCADLIKEFGGPIFNNNAGIIQGLQLDFMHPSNNWSHDVVNQMAFLCRHGVHLSMVHKPPYNATEQYKIVSQMRRRLFS